MKMVTISLVLLSVAALACGTRPESQPAAQARAEHPVVVKPAAEGERPVSNADESTPTVTLTGAIVGQSESRGKTMAAWNGVPAGETYFKLTLDPGQTRPEGAPEEPILRVPGADPSKGWVGKRVRITGRWTTPAPVETHVDAGGGHMMEMQAPIRAVNPASAGAEDPGAAEVVPREPILIADRVEII